jgi:predicted lipoprotein with Yx(FWY)xxD motif
VAAATAVALGACSSSSTSSSGSSQGSSPTYEVRAASVSGVGTVLVDGAGYTLYLFEPDRQSTPTCTGSCTSAWPPLVLPAGASPKAGAGAQAGLVGEVARSDGGNQVTYNRWPLYRWVGDTRPGVATGQGLDNFGGLWFVVTPDGAAVKG